MVDLLSPPVAALVALLNMYLLRKQPLPLNQNHPNSGMDSIVDDALLIIVKHLGPYVNKKDNLLKTQVGSLVSSTHGKFEYKFTLVALQRTAKRFNNVVNKSSFI